MRGFGELDERSRAEIHAASVAMSRGNEAVYGPLGNMTVGEGRAGQERKADLYTDTLKGCP
jgi:hypothetical protein